MIPQHYILAPIEAGQERSELRVRTECEVSQVPHRVFWRHDGVPVGNEGLVHLANIAEGPLAVLDDVRMKKVSV